MRISVALRGRLPAQRSKERLRHSKSREKYLEQSEVLHNNRSNDSRDNDSFLVQSDNYELMQKRFFMSSKNKDYIFSYQIYKTLEGVYCYSLYVKKGRVSHDIWQFHKFKEEIEKMLRPEDEISQQYASVFQHIAKITADMVLEQAEELR